MPFRVRKFMVTTWEHVRRFLSREYLPRTQTQNKTNRRIDTRRDVQKNEAISNPR